MKVFHLLFAQVLQSTTAVRMTMPKIKELVVTNFMFSANHTNVNM